MINGVSSKYRIRLIKFKFKSCYIYIYGIHHYFFFIYNLLLNYCFMSFCVYLKLNKPYIGYQVCLYLYTIYCIEMYLFTTNT